MTAATRLTAGALSLVVLLGGAAACGSEEGASVSGKDAARSSSPVEPDATSSPPLSTVPPPTQVQPTEPPKLPTDVPMSVTLTGELVGDGRTLLVQEQIRWLLVGDIQGYEPGDQVTVVGTPLLVRGPDPMEADEELTLRMTSIRRA